MLVLKAKNIADFPHPPISDAPLVKTRQNFWMKITPQKLEGWGYYRMVKIS